MRSSDSPFTLAHDRDAGQVTLEGLPAGPAGGASLIPADGVELVFDRADGGLSRVVVDAGEPGGPLIISEVALAVIGRLLGAQAGEAIGQAPQANGSRISVRVKPDAMTALSRLARLDAARVTSPVAQSPWWSVEAAQLADRAGLNERTATETRRALHAVEAAGAGASADGVPGVVVLAIADLVEATEPGLAMELRSRTRDDATMSSLGQPPDLQIPDLQPPNLQPPDLQPPDLQIPDLQPADLQIPDGHLQWSLDPRLVSPAVFRYGLWPGSDLAVRAGRRGIVVTAQLAPGGDRQPPGRFHARLVDPGRRKVIATAPFSRAGGCLVRAEIPQPVPAGEAWVEVADDEHRPVISTALRRIRRAMRWADAALYAARRSPGRDDAQWARMAALAWVRCTADWLAAGDPDRAYLAAVRCAAIRPDAPVPAPPSAWAKELASHPPLTEAPFLAEAAG